MMDVQKYLKLFAASESGAWMKAFEWQKVSIELLPFRVEGIATAAYCALSDRIRVAPDKEDSVFFSCVVHELRHAFQRRQMGLIAYLLTKTFRRSALEREAKDAEIDAAVWFCDRRVKEWRQKKEVSDAR